MPGVFNVLQQEESPEVPNSDSAFLLSNLSQMPDAPDGVMIHGSLFA